jgi:hypothetical protein
VKLREWLDKKDLIVPEFARILRVAPSTIYNWLNDPHAVPNHTKVCAVYKVTRGQVPPCDLHHLECPYRAAALKAQLADAEVPRETVAR